MVAAHIAARPPATGCAAVRRTNATKKRGALSAPWETPRETLQSLQRQRVLPYSRSLHQHSCPVVAPPQRHASASAIGRPNEELPVVRTLDPRVGPRRKKNPPLGTQRPKTDARGRPVGSIDFPLSRQKCYWPAPPADRRRPAVRRQRRGVSLETAHETGKEAQEGHTAANVGAVRGRLDGS